MLRDIARRRIALARALDGEALRLYRVQGVDDETLTGTATNYRDGELYE